VKKEAHAIEFSDKRVQPLDGCPVRNTTLVSFVKPDSVVDIVVVVAYVGFIAVALEGATHWTIGHFCDIFADYHVYNGAFSRA